MYSDTLKIYFPFQEDVKDEISGKQLSYSVTPTFGQMNDDLIGCKASVLWSSIPTTIDNQDFCIQFFIKELSDPSDWNAFFAMGYHISYGGGDYLQMRIGKAYGGDSMGVSVSTDMTIPNVGWADFKNKVRHIALCRESGIGRIYLDGSLQLTKKIDSFPASFTNFYFNGGGSYHTDTSYLSQFMLYVGDCIHREDFDPYTFIPSPRYKALLNYDQTLWSYK